MTRTKILGLLALSCIIFASCKDLLNHEERYQRPDWLAGKVYTQLKADPELSTFAKCIELTGYDTIIDVSGSYTVFAPDNEAFTVYLQDHPGYNTVEDIPADELLKLVKYHIVQNPWSKNQLTSLDIWGWIDSTDITNNKPRGYKRQTLLLEKDRNYGIRYNPGGVLTIVDTTATNWHRRINTDSRKYAPIFYKQYFDIYHLNSTDYQFYFSRPIESSLDIYFVGAKIKGNEIFAENGFVYHIDKVVDPLPNAYEILSSTEGPNSYRKFLELVNKFPRFVYNEKETLDQPGADLGLEVDSLFDLTFPNLTFNITAEETSSPPGTHGLPDNVTIRYHHGMVAPTDEAFNGLVQKYLEGPNRWGSMEEAPANIQRIVANSQLCVNPVYPTDFEKGFYNGEQDFITVDPASIVEKKYGSNCSFIGVNEMIVPRAFKAVTGPVYLLRGYNKMMLAVEYTGLLSALKKPNADYQFYVESDLNTRQDSSLLYEKRNGADRFFLYTRGGAPRRIDLSASDLRTLLMNHIGVNRPAGLARKEFIKNLAGNYLIVNNETGVVSGPTLSTDGYHGPARDPFVPVQISTDADNGITWDIPDWFVFGPTSMYLTIRDNFPAFQALLAKAGMVLAGINQYTFTNDNDIYTAFVPTADALTAYRADTLSIPDLRKFLLMHFIRGSIIFTDGNMSNGFYETLRTDEKSTAYSTVFTKIHIKPAIDVIEFVSKDLDTYMRVEESSTTNILAGRNLTQGAATYPSVIYNAAIHVIDTVLVRNRLDTR